MSNLWDKLNDPQWLPRFGEVVIKYQDGVAVSIVKSEQERLDPLPCQLKSSHKLPGGENKVDDTKNDKSC